MSRPPFTFRWWTDEEGRAWVRHDCIVDGHPRVDTWRLPPPWHVEGGGVTPSLWCTACGAHEIVGATERVNAVWDGDRWCLEGIPNYVEGEQ